MGSIAIIVAWTTLGLETHAGTEVPQYAVTASWLECCLRDLAGRDVPVVRVCPPGTCPGHFDLTPGSFANLQRCRVMFLFDFQKSIEEKLGALPGAGLTLTAVKAPEGLCVPSSYWEACGAVHAALVEAEPDKQKEYDAALERTRLRLAELELATREQVKKAGLKGTKVIVSKRQEAFCRWLGLEIVGTYTGGDSASPIALQSLVKDAKRTQAGLVIANLQEGSQFGGAVAERIGATLVVFSNFPSMKDGEDTFDALVQHNLTQLTAATPEQ